MTKRTARQHAILELKEKIMSKVANKMFTFKQTGIDGFIKRQFLSKAKPERSKSK
ncbi:MAG: hypothetical protein AAF541_19610 [Pseudomonadota bacterium]